jgi:hypothetical protein
MGRRLSYSPPRRTLGEGAGGVAARVAFRGRHLGRSARPRATGTPFVVLCGAMSDEERRARRELDLALGMLCQGMDAVFGAAHPAASIGEAAADFNTLLDRARRLFPESELIGTLRPLTPEHELVTLVTRVSTLKGAVRLCVSYDNSEAHRCGPAPATS